MADSHFTFKTKKKNINAAIQFENKFPQKIEYTPKYFSVKIIKTYLSNQTLIIPVNNGIFVRPSPIKTPCSTVNIANPITEYIYIVNALFVIVVISGFFWNSSTIYGFKGVKIIIIESTIINENKIP